MPLDHNIVPLCGAGPISPATLGLMATQIHLWSGQPPAIRGKVADRARLFRGTRLDAEDLIMFCRSACTGSNAGIGGPGCDGDDGMGGENGS